MVVIIIIVIISDIGMCCWPLELFAFVPLYASSEFGGILWKSKFRSEANTNSTTECKEVKLCGN